MPPRSYTETVYISRFTKVMACYCQANLYKFGFLYEYLDLVWPRFRVEGRTRID